MESGLVGAKGSYKNPSPVPNLTYLDLEEPFLPRECKDEATARVQGKEEELVRDPDLDVMAG